MNEYNGVISESEKLIAFAKDEFNEAKKQQDEMKARQVCEKSYLALLKAIDALFIKKTILS